MKTGATLFGVAAILAVVGYFGLQAFDRYEQHEAQRAEIEQQAKLVETLQLQNQLLQRQVEVLRAQLANSEAKTGSSSAP